MAAAVATHPGGAGSPFVWISARYFPLAWLSLCIAGFLHLFVGGSPEAIVDACFLGLNIAGHLLYRSAPERAVAFHLVMLGPMVFAYCATPGSLPSLIGQQALIFASLVALPNLVLASLLGLRWAVVSTPLGISGLVVLAADPGQLATGAFLLGISGILGGGFYHRLLSALEESRRRLAAAAYEDPMTGLGNRRAFAADFDREAGAGGAGLLVAVWDVDGLKAVNDEFGHAVGDAYLLSFTEALKRGCGPGTRLYRIGGDEFVSFHPGDAAMATVVESVRSRFPWVSVGAVAAAGRTLNGVLGDADERLYADKARRVAARRL